MMEDIQFDVRRRPKCFPYKQQTAKPLPLSSAPFPSKISLDQQEVEVSVETSAEGAQSKTSKLSYEEKKSPITHWRRADSTDVDSVTKLIEKSDYIMNDLFGEPDVPTLIEKSNFCMVQFNRNQELISFTSAFSYPDIPAVPSFEWFPWLEKSYKVRNATPRNCFFIHYMIWKGEYYHDFLRLTLETIFLENLFLSHIIITKPPKVKIPSIFMGIFIQVLPQDAKMFRCDANSLQTVLLCLRHSVMERLKIRLAIVEDHDDLMPIVEQHTQRLRELYGDFCMAEIIEYPGTKDRKTLVCESMGYAVGFMNINRFIDLELLNSQFDLGVFHGLRKPTKEDHLPEALSDDKEESAICLPDRVEPLMDIFDSTTMLKFLNWQPSLCASAEDLYYDSNSSEGQLKGYNELTKSMTSLIRDTMNLKIVPKFSSHALSSCGSRTLENSKEGSISSSDAPYIEFSVAEESHTPTESSLISLQHYNLPIYNGAPNAFCIEFLGIDNNFDDRICQDFLEAAFEVFPEFEYCLITIPSQAPTFPLLDFFTRVTPRPLKRFRQELYVCHKSAIVVSFMRVRRIVKSDLPETYKLLNGIKNQEFIYSDIASSCFYEDSAYQGFVLICSRSIVGVAVLCNEDGMEYLAHHYHVSDLIDFELHKIDYHAILKHLVLSPIYQSHARFFLRDVMRMADVTCLYRTRYEEVESNWNRSSVITVLGQFIPVKPRRMVKYHKPSLEPNIPPSYFLQTDLPFSLYHINSRVCGMRKFTSNINIVIVGSSRTAFSFLETLLFAPSSAYVTYNNITLVSPHGIGTEVPSHPARDLLFPLEGKFSRFYKIQMCIKTYVHFVYGVMTHINRAEKYIMINYESILPYDYLILLCGRQFTMPVPYVLMSDTQECRRNYRPRCSLFRYLAPVKDKESTTNLVYPGNVFLVNTEIDATNAFISLQYLVQKRKGFPQDEKIIIYGHKINVYLCVNSLLKYGIPPYMIVIVEPFPMGTHSVSCFMDPNIDRAVLKSLAELNIEHYQGYILYNWVICENKQIESVTFHAERRRITLKCLAMFPFNQKVVSDVTFKAVNEASLVYDGKLVINNCFQTNDKHIYAAGSLTKYQRKYYAKDKNHRYYSSSEVGKHLANIIRKKIDPTEEITEEVQSDMVPNMNEPLILYGELPGDWHYFRVTKPGKPRDPETRATIKEFGDVLTTGDCEMTHGYGYFKLVLDDYGFVEEIFCYTKDEIDVGNLEMLYGKHEKLLNNLLLRFDLGLIKDFYAYFREPWVYAIFHDQFKYVLKKDTAIFQEEKSTTNHESIVDLVVRTLKANNWNRPDKKKLEEIRETFEVSKIQEQIKNNILDFLYYFDEPFPMYATPTILRLLLYSTGNKALYRAPGQENYGYTKSAIKISESARR